MTVLGCLLFVLALLLCGFAVLALIDGQTRRSLAETIGLVLVLGAGTLGTPLTWASMIGARPTRLIILAIGFCAGGLIVLLGFLRGIPRPVLPKFRRATWNDLLLLLPLIPILGAVLTVAVVALRFDLFEADSIYIWGFKAKSLLIEPLKSMSPAFADPGLSFTHQDYPLLLPMLEAATYSLTGGVHEGAARLVFVLLFIGQVLLAFTAARHWLPLFGALVATALLVTLPFAASFSGVGNPDAAIETFYLCALVYLVRWLERPLRADLILCALFCAFMATTKNEGMPLAMIHALVLFGFIVLRRNQFSAWRDFGVFLSIVLIIAGIWWLWRARLPHTVDHYETQLHFSILTGNIRRLGIILPSLAKEAVTIPSWGVFWLLVPLAGIVGYKAFSRPQTWALWALFLLHVSLYVLVLVITVWDVELLLSVARNRLVMHIAPAGMLLIALHWSAITPILPPAE